MKSVAPAFLLLISCCTASAQSLPTNKVQLEVQFTPGKSLQQFTPSQLVGAAFDGHPEGEINHILTKNNIISMNQLGFGPLSYRLRTELGIEAWHWNPRGTWSEAGKQQGYWVSDKNVNGPIEISNGYYLPRRGNTHDQADDKSYSRLDDGDTTSFWKSNPYLDSYFTSEPNSLHPQWIVVDLGKLMAVNAMQIHWGNPYAIAYKVDYASDIGKDYFDPYEPNLWHECKKGAATGRKGGIDWLVFADKPVKARFIRITMTESSGTSAEASTDTRDKLGFAVKEWQVGWMDKRKRFHDYIRHGADNKTQSVTYASSTDPWHRAVDIDKTTEQAGVDLFFQCGLVNKQEVMMPIGLLYDNPDNMLALQQYLEARQYNVHEFEMGEEPEGQLIAPEDYAALYCQYATIMKKQNAAIRMGGPGFASLAITPEDDFSFTEQRWTRRLVAFLRNHQRLADLNFFTFEWYPFDDICAPSAPQLAAQPGMMMDALKALQNDILPAGTPLYMTEYGYSAYSGKSEVDIEGALMYADILARFLELGGNKSFLYGYEPTYLDEYNDCSWGNNMLFGMDENGKITYRTAAYYGMQMLTKHWLAPMDGVMNIFPVSSDRKNDQGQSLVSAYAIQRGNHKWSLLLINKDQRKEMAADIIIKNMNTGNGEQLHYPLQMQQYSSAQYHWIVNGAEGHPSLQLPPVNNSIEGPGSIILPPYSMTVLEEQ